LNLHAKIARLQLRSFPDAIAKRVLQREDVIALTETGSAEVGVLGTIHFSDIRLALSNCQFGSTTDVPRRGGAGETSIVRATTGLHSLRLAEGPEVVLPELGLLDPAENVRLSAYLEIAKRAKPCWPNQSSWHEILISRPLSDSEFGGLIGELQHLGDQQILRISAMVSGGSFGVSDLIPSDPSYYQSLVSGIANAESSEEYVVRDLAPHLTNVLNADVSWGLRCIRAVSVCTTLDSVAITDLIADDDLFAALNALGPGATPFSLLTTIRIAQARATSDARFGECRDDALDKLIELASPNVNGHTRAELFPALMRLTLNAISMNDAFALAPPYWRRLAAFAHATILLESLSFQGWDLHELASWCEAQQSMDTAALGILDLVRDPFWRSDFQTNANLSVTALIASVGWNPVRDDYLNGLSPRQAEMVTELYPELRLAYGLPGPLSGGRTHNDDGFEETIGLELLDGFTRDKSTVIALNSHQAWNALGYSSRIFSFSKELLVALREIARSIHLQGSTISEEDASVLSCVAEVAALQRDEELAGILATCVLKGVESRTRPIDAATSAAILVMASGARLNWNDSLLWAADRLMTLAYRVPRGASAQELANWIEVLQRFIPLEDRRWGKAWIIARSAS
jgi:hypothetical protein